MSAVLDLPITEIKTSNALKSLILQAIENRLHTVFFDVSWKTYLEIIEETPSRRNPKIFYDKGTLEIMPKFKHDRPNRILSVIVTEISGEIGLDVEDSGSTTLREPSSEQGFEPDTGFYFGEKAAFIRQKEDIDLEFDPSPDLIIEIDVTSSSLNRFELFAAAQISEVWVFENELLKIFRLQESKYVEIETSQCLKDISSQQLAEFVAQSRKFEKHEWRKLVRTWARENLKK